MLRLSKKKILKNVFKLQKAHGGARVQWEPFFGGHALGIELSKLTSDQFQRLLN